MQIKKGRTAKLLMAIFKHTVLHIHVVKDTLNDNHQYLRFSLYSYKPNQYMDIIFRLEDTPQYVQYIYRFIEGFNRISISDDRLSYIIQGPCLESNQIFKISNIFVVDYHMMLARSYEFMYDIETSKALAENMLRPVFELINK